MRNCKVLLAKGVCPVMAAIVLASCGGQREEETAPPVRPIKLITVEDYTDQFSASFPAVFEAAQSTELTFQVGGLLQELPVVEGQPVAEGTLIAKLDQRDFQNNFNSIKAQFDNAESEYQRARRLAAENAISQSILEQRLSQRDIAKAQYDTAQKSLDDTELFAPYDGQIAEVFVENFQNVSPQQAIVAFQSTGDVEAVINLPARLVAYVPQLVPIDPTVTLDVAPEFQFPATFKEITGQADPTTQTYRASFTFESPENFLILPGMTGTVSSTFQYTGDRFEGGVSVPLGSIVTDGGKKYVWVVDEQTMTVSKREITVSEERIGATVTVMTGLENGEVIAGAGASYLQEGMAVRAWEIGQQKLCGRNSPNESC